MKLIVFDCDAIVQRLGVLSGASLLAETAPRRVHQDVAHRLRRGGEEVGTVAPVGALLTSQLEVGLMHQSGGLQGVIAALPTHVALRHPTQVRIDERQQLLGREARAFALVAQVGDDLGGAAPDRGIGHGGTLQQGGSLGRGEVGETDGADLHDDPFTG